MNVRSLVYLGTAVLVAMTVLLALALVDFSNRMQAKLSEAELAAALVRNANELAFLAEEFVSYRLPRIEQQWQGKYDAARALLRDAPRTDLLGKIDIGFEALDEKFRELQVLYREAPPGYDGEDPQVAARRRVERENRLATRVRLIYTRISLLAFRYSSLADAEVRLMHERSKLTVFSYVAVQALTVVLFGVLLVRRFAKRLGLLSDQAQAIGAGRLESRLPDLGRDEFGRLAATLNDMSGRIETLVRAEKASGDELRREIGERRQVEEALRCSEARFRDFADIAADWFWETDAAFRFTFLSGRIEDVLGVGPEEVLDKTRAEYHRGHADTSAPEWKAHFATLDAHQPFEAFEFDWRGPRGVHQVSLTGRPLFDDNGAFTGYRGVGRDVTALRRASRQLKQLLADNQHLTRGLIGAQDAERRRIAREMHDDMGQALTAIQAEAETLHLMWPDTEPRIADSIDAISRHAGQVYSTMHEIMERLHPAPLDDLGLIGAVRDLCTNWGRRHEGVTINLELEPGADGDTEQRVALYRIVQESLTNISKYAQPRTVGVSIEQVDGESGRELALEVYDDGNGVDMRRRGRGLGLLSITERAAALGGRAEFASAPGRGFRVSVRLPLRVAAT